MTGRRVIDDPVALAKTARLFRRVMERPCPDIATSGMECDDCAARRASDPGHDEARDVAAGPDAFPPPSKKDSRDRA